MMAEPENVLKPGRKQKRGDATRRQILVGARDEFAKMGFEGASMRGIARSLGIELANIQHHYRDKAGLWNAVLDDVFGAVANEVARVHALHREEEPDVAIQAMVTAIVHYAASNPHFVVLMSHARFDPKSHEARGYQLSLRDSITTLTRLIELAQKRERFVPGNPSLLFYQLVGAAIRIFTAAADAEAIIGKPPTSPDVIQEHLAICLSVFMPHLQGNHTTLSQSPPAAAKRPEKSSSSQNGQRPALLYLVGQVDALIAGRMSKELEPLGLTMAKMIAFVRIARGNKPSAATLARLLDVTPQSVMVIVRGLEEQGLIHRQESAAGRRRLLLDVTESGQAVLARLGDIISEIEHDIFDTLDSETRNEIREALVNVLLKTRPLSLSEWTPLMRSDRAIG
jgi:TetR/AcrR family transcriptional regulator